MAQLSDDCFAFGGPMMSVDEAVGIIAARVAGGRGGRDRCARAMPTAAFSRATLRRRCRCRPSPIPPSTAMRSQAAICRKDDGAGVCGHRPRAGRQLRRGEPIKPGHAVRIFTGAPMPDGADTVFMQEDVRVDGGKVVLACRAEARRQCAPRRRRYSARPCGAEGRAAAAAAGCRARRRLRPDADRRRQAHPRRRVFHRRRTGLAGRCARARRNCSIPTASC